MPNEMETSRLTILIKKAMNRTATSDERDELFALLADLDNKRFVEQLLADAWDNFHSKQSVFSSDESDEMLQRIMAPHRAEGNPVPADRKSTRLNSSH